MRILSWNVNGIRSVVAKSFSSWVQENHPDIVCLQEIKAQESDVPDVVKRLSGYNLIFNTGTRKGHGGVAVLSRRVPTVVVTTLGHERFDLEGRMIELQFPEFTLVNLYLPHGGRDKRDLQYKLDVYRVLLENLQRGSDYPTILIGDFNIAHSDGDLRRPGANRNNIMFTTQERQLITRLLEHGYEDSFRKLNPGAHQYTWWSYMKGVRERNIGWRIDYAFVSNALASRVKAASIQDHVFGSDHCPILLELE